MRGDAFGNTKHGWRTRSRSIRKGGWTGRWVVGWLGGEREGLYIFILNETPDVAASVLGVDHILQLLLISAADPEEDGQRDDGDTTDTTNNTTNDGTDDGGWCRASSKANLVVLGPIRIPNLDDAK